MSRAVKAWEETVNLPTYGLGPADELPQFLEQRVYQGSSGAVYPYKVTDIIIDEKKDKTYRAVYLENAYLKIMVLPELGGRIHMAYDKTAKRHFVYYNSVVKPALVGLTGPWISGGIEFNWPQHHRPSTHEPLEYTIVSGEGGTRSVCVGEIEKMSRLKCTTFFTLRPDRAVIEITGKVYNPTPLSQTFLWWANPAVKGGEGHQSVFPPDVHAVFDHGKRDVSRFPIATGQYYKADYAAGVDISRYKNIPVPTSYMAYKSDYDFVGAYQHDEGGGLLHVADRHISPGKKQWTWGTGNFGRVWDRNLTDGDGPYIELMTGVYTDNQPDFAWIDAYEEKVFTQYFMPYRELGVIKNANTRVALKFEVEKDGFVIGLYATGIEENLNISVTDRHDGTPLLQTKVTVSPDKIWLRRVSHAAMPPEHRCRVLLSDAADREVLRYVPEISDVEALPKPAVPPAAPDRILSVEELYLTGLHIEQYRNVSVAPEAYYLEGLKRDGGDYRCNLSMGRLLLRRGAFEDALGFLEPAVERATLRNPNPYDGEALFLQATCYEYLERWREAYDTYYKSTWNGAFQDKGFFALARLSLRRGDNQRAAGFLRRSLNVNGASRKSRHLYAVLLRLGALDDDARVRIERWLADDPLDYALLYEASRATEAGKQHFFDTMAGRAHGYIEIAINYAALGRYAEAFALMSLLSAPTDPMVFYYLAYFADKLGKDAKGYIRKAESLTNVTHFPNKLEDIMVLEFACTCADTPQASYQLGNLYYDKRRHALGADCWAGSLRQKPTAASLRNLAIYSYNKLHDQCRALDQMQRAFALAPDNPRILAELDQLHKKAHEPADKRLQRLCGLESVVRRRDELYIEWVELHNLCHRFERAQQLILSRYLHPWEGGEGNAAGRFLISLIGAGANALQAGNPEGARDIFLSGLEYPENINEGKLIGATDNDLWYLAGLASRVAGDHSGAALFFERAASGSDYVGARTCYYDQPADYVFFQGLARLQLGDTAGANERFYKLIDGGERYYYDTAATDFFAISKPDFNVFEDPPALAKQAHNNFILWLGYLAMGESERAGDFHRRLMAQMPYHDRANIIRYLCSSGVIDIGPAGR